MIRIGSVTDYARALGAVAVATAVCTVADGYFDLADQAMIYLLAVLVVAAKLSRGPSVFTAIASVGALNFFFVPPLFTFAVQDARHLVTFGVMLGVGLVVSGLTAAVRERERRTAALYAMSRELAVIGETTELARVAVRHVGELLGASATIVLARPGGALRILASTDAEPAPEELEISRRAISDARTMGWGSAEEPGAPVLALPLRGTRGSVGALLVHRPPRAVQLQMVETFVAQIALAIERALIAEEAEKARTAAQIEQTRNTLLAGLSHDLRTPLASIGGSSSTLLDPTAALDETSRRELLETIRDESARLTQLVVGLLDLVRIESGALEAKKEWCPLEEILSSAISRLDATLGGREVHTKLGEKGEMLLAAVDPVLFEQVSINLIENACKYSPAGSAIDIRACLEGGSLHVDFEDRGPGLPPGEEERVFEKFYRAPDSSRTAGAGIGLALCDAIVKAHGGHIGAKNAPGGGTVVSIVLPASGATA